MGWDVTIRGKTNAVTTHLGDDVFSQNDNLLSAVLDATRVAGEDGPGDTLPKLGRDAVRERRSEI